MKTDILRLLCNGLSFVLLTMLCFYACSCYGRRELEDLSLVTILGIDKGKQKLLLITADIALPIKMNDEDITKNETKSTDFLMSAEGNSLLDALAQMTRKTSRRTTTAHTQILLLGEELARDDASVVLDVFSRNLDFRHNTFIAVCKGSASQFMNQFSWPEESRASDYLTKLLTSCYHELGICPLVSVHDFLIAYSIEEIHPWTPYLTVSAPLEKTSVQNESRSDSKQIVTLLGSAIFKKNGSKVKMINTLDTSETMAVNMLQGSFERGFIDIPVTNGIDKITTLEFQHFSISRKTKIIDEGNVSVNFKARVTASMEESTAQTFELTPDSRNNLIHAAELELKKLLDQTFTKLQAFDSDVIKLGMTVHRHFNTWTEWKEFDWASKFRNTAVTYDIKIFVFTSGFTKNPPTPK